MAPREPHAPECHFDHATSRRGGFADEGISFSIFRNSIYFGGTSGVELGTRLETACA